MSVHMKCSAAFITSPSSALKNSSWPFKAFSPPSTRNLPCESHRHLNPKNLHCCCVIGLVCRALSPPRTRKLHRELHTAPYWTILIGVSDWSCKICPDAAQGQAFALLCSNPGVSVEYDCGHGCSLPASLIQPLAWPCERLARPAERGQAQCQAERAISVLRPKGMLMLDKLSQPLGNLKTVHTRREDAYGVN